MAKKLTDFDFAAAGGNKPYPWAEWTDGSTWELKQGEDFTCTPRSLRTQIYKYASENDLAPRTRIDGDRFILQFRPRNK